MTKETVTMHTAYSWVERNHIGPVPVLHYGSRQFDFDQQDEEALAEACSDLPVMPHKDSPHMTVVTETELTWRDVFLCLSAGALGLGMASLIVIGACTVIGWFK